jgi:FkbM family methyltransferase
MKWFWKTLLKSHYFRKSIITHILADYFHEIGHSIQIKNGYWAQILNNDAYDSFSEIFIKNEYVDFLPNATIRKVVDIGAHYGYFSLWLQSLNGNITLESLMIEPCINCHHSIDELIRDKKLIGITQMIDGVIDDPKLGHASFFDRPFMASTSIKNSAEEDVRRVQIITEDDIINKMQPPYDLIKCDIEGSEWELLLHYPKILSGARYLILEWHSWHNGGGGKSQIEEQLSSINFKIVKESNEQVAIGRTGKVGLLLAQNNNSVS